MTDVFISYSRRNKEIIQSFFEKLEQRGKNAWVDWEDIPFSTNWWKEIQDGIDNALVFLFVVSPDSLKSEVCNMELAHALENRKRFIPIVCEDITDSEIQSQIFKSWNGKKWKSMAKANHKIISERNWIMMRNLEEMEKAVSTIIDTIDNDPAHLKAHTQYLLKARQWKQENRDESLLLRGSELQRAEYWLEFNSEKSPTPSALHKKFIEESIELRNKLAVLESYQKARDEALKQYVMPYLKEKRKDIEARIASEQDNVRQSTYLRGSEGEFAARDELNVVDNFLGNGGKWHPQKAVYHSTAGPDTDYADVYQFPCCGKSVLGDNTSQFQADGCQVAPILSDK